MLFGDEGVVDALLRVGWRFCGMKWGPSQHLENELMQQDLLESCLTGV